MSLQSPINEAISPIKSSKTTSLFEKETIETIEEKQSSPIKIKAGKVIEIDDHLDTHSNSSSSDFSEADLSAKNLEVPEPKISPIKTERQKPMTIELKRSQLDLIKKTQQDSQNEKLDSLTALLSVPENKIPHHWFAVTVSS